MTSTYNKNDRVRFLPEFAGEDTGTYLVVTEDEGKGRIDVTPEACSLPIPPIETVSTDMVERC
jgi:hypothetical protein